MGAVNLSTTGTSTTCTAGWPRILTMNNLTFHHPHTVYPKGTYKCKEHLLTMEPMVLLEVLTALGLAVLSPQNRLASLELININLPIFLLGWSEQSAILIEVLSFVSLTKLHIQENISLSSLWFSWNTITMKSMIPPYCSAHHHCGWLYFWIVHQE